MARKRNGPARSMMPYFANSAPLRNKDLRLYLRDRPLLSRHKAYTAVIKEPAATKSRKYPRILNIQSTIPFGDPGVVSIWTRSMPRKPKMRPAAKPTKGFFEMTLAMLFYSREGR